MPFNGTIPANVGGGPYADQINEILAHLDLITPAMPEFWNAVGDGSNEDAPACQSALNASRAFKGWPGAEYKCSTGLSVPANTFLDLRGVAFNVPTEIHLFTIAGDNVTILMGEVDGMYATKTLTRYCVNNAGGYNNLTVIGTKIRDWAGNGIYSRGSRTIVRDVEVESLKRNNGDAFTDGVGVFIHAVTADVEDAVVENTTVKDWGGEAAILMAGDWNRVDWKTAGAFIRRGKIDKCTADGAASGGVGGIMLLHAIDSRIVGSNGDNTNDIGLDMEFCVDCEIADSNARGNATAGAAVYQSNVGCSLDHVTCCQNEHGFLTHHNPTALGAETSDIRHSNCRAEGNTGQGFMAQAGTYDRVRYDSCESLGNGGDGFTVDIPHVALSACVSKGNARGLVAGLLGAFSGLQIEGGDYSYNNTTGIALLAAGASLSTGISIGSDFKVIGNLGDGIVVSPDTVNVDIGKGQITNNGGRGIGRFNETGARGVGIRVKETTVIDNAGNAIDLPWCYDSEVVGTTVQGFGTNIGINMQGISGYAGGKLLIARNNVKGGDTGIAVSAGANVSPGDDVWVEDNDVDHATVPTMYLFTQMGSGAWMWFTGVFTGVPAFAASPGSLVRRIDGGAGSSLYLKETPPSSTVWRAI